MSRPIVGNADPRARGALGDDRLARQHRRGDRRARVLLIERYLPMASRLAARYRQTSEPVADLEQVAAVGLVKAVDRWDPDRGIPFAAFGAPTILGELRHHFRDATWDVRPPRRVAELCRSVEQAHGALRAEIGREPSTAEVAASLNQSREAVEEAIEAGASRRLASVDTPVSDRTGMPSTVGELVGETDVEYARVEARATVERLVAVLDARARRALRLWLEEGLHQHEIAQQLGCSQVHVSRILRRAIRKLAAYAEAASEPGLAA